MNASLWKLPALLVNSTSPKYLPMPVTDDDSYVGSESQHLSREHPQLFSVTGFSIKPASGKYSFWICADLRHDRQARPTSIDELFERVAALAGKRFSELAEQVGLTAPKNLRRDKGWVGQLLELHLGATAGSKPTQDFPELGVELKTLPVTPEGEPLETTFVCSAPLTNIEGVQWATSNVRNKLQHVLWLPIDGRRDVPVPERVVGSAFLWAPNKEEERLLRTDWEEHMDRIALGQVESITARQGDVMQIRPKAADGSVLTDAIGPEGTIIKVRPRGFYLKKDFTRQILQRVFA